MNNSVLGIISAIQAERAYQDKKWGGADNDDNHSQADWVYWIKEYAAGKSERTQKYSLGIRFIKCAALAVAAIEGQERETKERGDIDQVAIIQEATSTVAITDDVTPPTYHSTLVLNLIRYAGPGEEVPKAFRANMLRVIAYCVKVLMTDHGRDS